MTSSNNPSETTTNEYDDAYPLWDGTDYTENAKEDMNNSELIARLRYYHKPNDTTIDDACNAIEALEVEVANLKRKNTVTQGIAGEAQAERDALQAQLAAAQGQSPWAWAYQCSAGNNGPVFSKTKSNWADSGTGLWTETPLYAAPIPQQPGPSYDYQATFNAIAGAAKQGANGLEISVSKFWESYIANNKLAAAPQPKEKQ